MGDGDSQPRMEQTRKSSRLKISKEHGSARHARSSDRVQGEEGSARCIFSEEQSYSAMWSGMNRLKSR